MTPAGGPGTYAVPLDGLYRDWLDDPVFRATEPSVIGFSHHFIASATRG